MLELENITGPDELFDDILQGFDDIPDIVIVGEDSVAEEQVTADVEIYLAERAILAAAQHEEQQTGNTFESIEDRQSSAATDNEPDEPDIAPQTDSNEPPIDLPPPTLQGSPDDEEGPGRDPEQLPDDEATRQRALEADQILRGPVEIRGKVFGEYLGIRVEGGRYVAPPDYVPGDVATPKVRPLIFERMAAQATEQADLPPDDQDQPQSQPENIPPSETDDDTTQAQQRAENLRRLQSATWALREPIAQNELGEQPQGSSLEFVLNEPQIGIEPDTESIRYWEQREIVYRQLVEDAEANPNPDPEINRRLLENLRDSVAMAQAQVEQARAQGKKDYGVVSADEFAQRIHIAREALYHPSDAPPEEEDDKNNPK